MKKLIAGNWKMNGSMAGSRQLVESVIHGIDADPSLLGRCDFLVCPTYVHLGVVKGVIDHNRAPVMLGAQDCAVQDSGAFTGDVAAGMLRDFGCGAVIVGHSERRQYHGETDETVAAKAARAHAAGLTAIICIGETDSQREAGQAQTVVSSQLAASIPAGATAANTVIAYEPVWAIGTGKTATPDDVAIMHALIREKLGAKIDGSAGVRILYGGSVKPENAAELLAVANVDGALIGGASLKPDQYLGIAKAAR